MKIQKILAIPLALALASTSAKADVEILITGATAFRAATLDTIKALYDAGNGLNQAYEYAHDAASGLSNASTRSVWKGFVAGIPGTTTVRCTFNGSVEGVRAVALGGVHNPTFLTDAALTGTPADNGAGVAPAGAQAFSTSTPTTALTAKFSFSDSLQSSTPVTSPSLAPADPRVGVVVFTMLANEGAPAALNNVSNQQFRALFGNGFQPLSLFTNNLADTNLVFASGRNDGSGTRTIYLAETGYGISNLVQQYVANTSTSTALTSIRLTNTTTDASTVWGQNQAGNGGASSGSSLRGDFGKTSAACQVVDSDGTTELLPAGQIHLITGISLNDAVVAIDNGAKALGYNGVHLPGIEAGNNTLNATDLALITNGAYSYWSNENLYYSGSLSADQNTFYTALKTGISTNLAAAGIPLTTMNVSRSLDGGPIAP